MDERGNLQRLLTFLALAPVMAHQMTELAAGDIDFDSQPPATKALTFASGVQRTHTVLPTTFLGRLAVDAPKGSNEIMRNIKTLKQSPPSDAPSYALCIPRLAGGQLQLRKADDMSLVVYISVNRVAISSRFDDCIGFTTHTRVVDHGDGEPISPFELTQEQYISVIAPPTPIKPTPLRPETSKKLNLAEKLAAVAPVSVANCDDAAAAQQDPQPLDAGESVVCTISCKLTFLIYSINIHTQCLLP